MLSASVPRNANTGRGSFASNDRHAHAIDKAIADGLDIRVPRVRQNFRQIGEDHPLPLESRVGEHGGVGRSGQANQGRFVTERAFGWYLILKFYVFQTTPPRSHIEVSVCAGDEGNLVLCRAHSFFGRRWRKSEHFLASWKGFGPGGCDMTIFVPWKPVVLLCVLLSLMIWIGYVSSCLIDGKNPFRP